MPYCGWDDGNAPCDVPNCKRHDPPDEGSCDMCNAPLPLVDMIRDGKGWVCVECWEMVRGTPPCPSCNKRQGMWASSHHGKRWWHCLDCDEYFLDDELMSPYKEEEES